jgi:hypothetical protein
MVNVCVLQTDNRPSLDYLLKTQEVNKKTCSILGYEYKFILFENNFNVDHKSAKLYIVSEFLQKTNNDILVFLDSDAWIQNGYWLNDMINRLINTEEKQGCFSRDPYEIKNTFINSGSFIIKINNYTKQLYKESIISFENDIKNNTLNKFGWKDQWYISKYVFENKEKFVIFTPYVLNTPEGKVLRHNWAKNQKMYKDLNELSSNLNSGKYFSNTLFFQEDYYDELDYPNKTDMPYNYVD